MSQSTVLSWTNLAVGYTHELCRLADMTIASGEVMALVGPNGGGKSTLLRTLGKIIPAFEGQVDWHGLEMGQHFSGINPYGELLVEEIWAMSMKTPYDTGLIPNYWNVHELQHKTFSLLSDGQRQKVLLVRAMLNDASVLLLDEPSTHLDYQSVDELQKVLTLLKSKEKTIVFSSHDWSLIRAVADRVLELNASRATLYADPEEIYRSLKT